MNSSLPLTYQTAAPLRMFPQNRYNRQVISDKCHRIALTINFTLNQLTNTTARDRSKHPPAMNLSNSPIFQHQIGHLPKIFVIVRYYNGTTKKRDGGYPQILSPQSSCRKYHIKVEHGNAVSTPQN